MRQNTSSPRNCLPFQCFHTCTAPGNNHKVTVLFVRGASPARLKAQLVAFPLNEPVRVDMLYTGSRAGIHRFVAQVPLDEGASVQRYSFKISLLDKESGQICDVVWYSSLGMSRECPLLQHCFAFELNSAHPAWTEDLVLYQVLPDRFASSKGYFTIDAQRFKADAPIHDRAFEYKDLNAVHCGGDLDGIVDMLPYIRSLGCDGIYLTPVFKSGSPLKYEAEDYDVVDAHLGGNGALKRLRARTFGYEMRLILNAPLNYTGDNHPWFDRQERTGKGALHHEDSPSRDHYTFRMNDDAVYSGGRGERPKLNYASKSVRHAIYNGHNSVIKKYLRVPYGIDGWCLDSASQLGDHGTSENNVRRLKQLTHEARAVREDTLMLGDFHSDARYALNSEHNLDGAINYTGFLSPIRAFFGGVNLTGDPTPYTGEDLRRTCENYSVGTSQQVKLCLVNELDTPELPRFFSIIGGDKALYQAALAVLFTWRGIPCIYQGDELGDAITLNDLHGTSPLPFLAMKDHHVTPYSAQLQSLITELAALRRSNEALTLGSQCFICAGGAYFGFVRLYNNRFSLVLVNASRQAVKLEQGSMLLPLLAAMYLPTDGQDKDLSADTGESLLIPLSGRNVRRTDHGEGLEALYELLSREDLKVCAYGLTSTSEEYEKKCIAELTAGKTLTLPARTTVVVNNAARE